MRNDIDGSIEAARVKTEAETARVKKTKKSKGSFSFIKFLLSLALAVFLVTTLGMTLIEIIISDFKLIDFTVIARGMVTIVFGILAFFSGMLTISQFRQMTKHKEMAQEKQDILRELNSKIRASLAEGGTVELSGKVVKALSGLGIITSRRQGKQEENLEQAELYREELLSQTKIAFTKAAIKGKGIIIPLVSTISFAILTVLSAIEMALLSIPGYNAIAYYPTTIAIFLTIFWIAVRIHKSNMTIDMKNNAVVLYFDLPEKQVGSGPLFALFKDVNIPFLNIVVSRVIEVSKKELVFDVHKDKVFLALPKHVQPFWFDVFFSYIIVDIVEAIITTGEETLEGIRTYIEGKEQTKNIEDESGEKVNMTVKTGGLADLKIRSGIRSFAADMGNFEIEETDNIGTIVRKVTGIKEELNKYLNKQLNFLPYFGMLSVRPDVTDIVPSEDVSEKLIKAATTEQDILIATNEMLASVEKDLKGLKLLKVYKEEFNIPSEVESLITLLSIQGDAIKGILEGTNLNIAAIPALDNIAKAFSAGRSPSENDLSKLLNTINQKPETLEEIKKAISLLDNLGIKINK